MSEDSGAEIVTDLLLVKATNIVKGQLKDSDGNPLPPGTKLSLWGEEFSIGENGTFVSPPLPDSVNQELIKVTLPDGTIMSDFSAPFVSGVVPAFVELNLDRETNNNNHAPSVVLKAFSNQEISSRVSPGGSLSIVAIGEDHDAEDQGFLTITWNCTNGSFTDGSDEFNKTWNAPSFLGVATISAEIRDSRGKTGKISLPILIGIDDPLQIDASRPEVSLTTDAESISNSVPFYVTVTFNEAVKGFTLDKISAENASLDEFYIITNEKVFKVRVTPSNEGEIRVFVAEKVVTDYTGNQNTASNILTVNNGVVTSKSSEKEILSFSAASVTGTIDTANKKVVLNLPHGTDISNLVTNFTVSEKASVKVGDTVQTSGTTANDFSSTVTYTVIAEDGSTQNWEVTVSFLPTSGSVITSIEVTTQPTKLIYAEGTDEILALNGMVITESYNDGSTRTVSFTDGTAAGYTANPPNGATLTNAANNGEPVVITNTAFSKTANTNKLTVGIIPDLAAADIKITAPVLGATPEDAAAVEAATSNADYTVTALTWNEAMTADGKFKAGQTYTATLTLTSKNNRKFQAEPFIPTVSGFGSAGATTTNGSDIGNTVSFMVTYPSTGALAVSSITVTTQPTKLAYTEVTDGTLALNGMIVTETNNDGTTNTVSFTNGTAIGYTTNPANGANLTNADHNTKPVVVTHTASGQTVNTSNLGVSTQTEISAAAVTITVPVAGGTPENAAAVETATANADYTVTALSWNEALTVGGKFKAGQAYTANVTLTSKNSKKFQSAQFTPTVTGANLVSTTTTTGSDIGNTVSFTVTYTSTAALAVSSIAVITQPTKLNYAEATDGTLALNGMVITETNNDGTTNLVTFTGGTAAGYTANPANGATLTHVANNGQPVVITHAISGKTANTNNLTVTAIPEISAAALTITAPVAGGTPENAVAVETATSNNDYSVTVLTWNEPLTAGFKFKAGQVYTVDVVLTSKNNKKFQATPFTPTVVGSSSVSATTTYGSNIGNIVTFTVTYPSTVALAVTSISVTTQPTKLNYAEGTDGILALNGMVVTETNNDGTTNTVAFSDGTASGYTANPANGTDLTLPTNNGNPVVVNHTASGQTANTSNLVVSRDFFSTSIGALKFVPAGTFQRDGNSANTSYVSAFRMGKNEISRAQYDFVMGLDPADSSVSSGVSDPVQCVRWYDAIVFCNKLSVKEGLTPVYTISDSTNPDDWGAIPNGPDAAWNAVTCNWSANGYRLPTEMEWMWAAMGADQDSQPGAMSGGINVKGYNKPFAGYNGSNSLADFAWQGNIVQTHPKGTKGANELGLHDMSGNVAEWCWDWFGLSFPNGSISNYTGAVTDLYERAVRNSEAWRSSSYMSVKTRFSSFPYDSSSAIGFRVVRGH